MEERNNLFRMSFIIQDNAAMTLDTNLVKIIESILLDAKGARLSSDQIAKNIATQLNLNFSNEEIQHAIAKKGKNIQTIGNLFFLKPDYMEKLSKQENFKSQIEKFAETAINELNLDVSKDKFIQLLTDYLYYCFNSNKDSILALINNTEIQNSNFHKSEEDIKLINTFLGWKNPQKDKFIYNVVSYGYIYCTLTVKKNDLLANRLFRGKKFILDANIIFRLAGINNDSRMNTIKSFVDKCNEVGVSLCYTTATLEEIKRVIVNKVKWIMSVTGEQKPLDLTEFDYSENDFYSIYCKWASNGANKHDDYTAFQRYLTNLVMDVMEQLEKIDSINYGITKLNEFNSLMASLQTYKEKHSNKKQTKASLKTDINNFMLLRNLRNADKNDNIWTTNIFFISADQLLIKWASETEMGIPLVVLPSVWLTIMLRFSGRTSNDYKAFCSFLELRTHQPEASINVFELLQSLSEKTDSNELKKKVVREIFEHKDIYEEYINEGYDQAVEKAFDTIMSTKEKEEQKKYEALRNQYNAKEKELHEYELQQEADTEFQIRRLVDNDCKKRFKFIRLLDRFKILIGFIVFIFICILTGAAIFNQGILFILLNRIAPETVISTGNTLSVLGIVWGVGGIGAGFVGTFIHFLASLEGKYRNKREKYYRDLFIK